MLEAQDFRGGSFRVDFRRFGTSGVGTSGRRVPRATSNPTRDACTGEDINGDGGSKGTAHPETSFHPEPDISYPGREF